MGPGHPRIKHFHHHLSLFFMAKSDARIHRRRSRQPKHVEITFEHLGKAHVTGVYVRAVMIPRAERIIPKGTPENGDCRVKIVLWARWWGRGRCTTGPRTTLHGRLRGAVAFPSVPGERSRGVGDAETCSWRGRGRPVADFDVDGTLADISREIGDSGLRGREVGNHGARFRRGDARGIAAQVWGQTDQHWARYKRWKLTP